MKSTAWIQAGAIARVRGLPDGHNYKEGLEGKKVVIVKANGPPPVATVQVQMPDEHDGFSVLISVEYLRPVKRLTLSEIDERILSRASAYLKLSRDDLVVRIEKCTRDTTDRPWMATLSAKECTRFWDYGKTPRGSLIKLLRSLPRRPQAPTPVCLDVNKHCERIAYEIQNKYTVSVGSFFIAIGPATNGKQWIARAMVMRTEAGIGRAELAEIGCARADTPEMALTALHEKILNTKKKE